MIEKIGQEKWKGISEPCVEVIEQLRLIKNEKKLGISVAEIGVGIGATTIEIIKILGEEDTLFLFSYEDEVNELKNDLEKINCNNVEIVACGNSRCMLDSYSWNLAKMVLSMYETSNDGVFDLVYLDGAHTFIHDALSAALIKILLRPNGVIIFDDVFWTIMKSPTNNPDIKPINAKLFTKEQMETPNIDMVCKIFMDRDESFFRIKNANKWRAIYKKIK